MTINDSLGLLFALLGFVCIFGGLVLDNLSGIDIDEENGYICRWGGLIRSNSINAYSTCCSGDFSDCCDTQTAGKVCYYYIYIQFVKTLLFLGIFYYRNIKLIYIIFRNYKYNHIKYNIKI